MELVPYSVQLLLSWKKYQWTRMGVLGTSTYAGGVSDSIYGATAYAYMDTNLK